MALRPNTGDAVFASDAPIVKISPLFEALMHSANGLLKGRHYGAAVLVTETALEVCTQRIIARALDQRNVGSLSDWIGSLRRPYILTTREIRELYEAVTGDTTIAQAPFWSRLKDHVTRRHAVAHKGQSVNDVEASESHAVVWEAIRHMSKVAAGLNLDLSDRP